MNLIKLQNDLRVKILGQYKMNGTDIIGLVLAGMMAFVWWQVRKNQGCLKLALHTSDGALMYVTEKKCTETHEKYQKGICDKIDDIKTIVKEMDASRDLARKEDATWKEEMSRALGRIEGGLNK